MNSNIPSLSKGKTGEKTVIEDVEDDKDELSDLDYSKATARLFDEMDNGKAGFPPIKFCWSY